MKIKKYLALLGVSLSLVGVTPIIAYTSPVYAETTKQNTFKEENSEVVASAYIDDAAALSLFSQISNDSNEFAKAKILSVDMGKRVIYFDNNAYQGLYLNDRKEFLRYSLKAINYITS